MKGFAQGFPLNKELKETKLRNNICFCCMYQGPRGNPGLTGQAGYLGGTVSSALAFS